MDNIIKFQIDKKRGLKSRDRRKKFLRLKHIKKAAKERKSYEPKLRLIPPIKMPLPNRKMESPKYLPSSLSSLSTLSTYKVKTKSSKFKNICKKLSAIFVTKK